MGMSFLDDPIKVTCAFGQGKVEPITFEWQQRQYQILSTIFRFKTSQGTEPLLIFSCETNQGIFDLTFNLKSLSWRIKAFHQPT